MAFCWELITLAFASLSQQESTHREKGADCGINMKFLSKKGKAKSHDEGPEVDFDEVDTKEAERPPEQAPNKSEEPTVVYKFGIADRLEDAVNSRSASKEKRSPDLVPLSKEFDSFRKRLRQLHLSAKQYHDSLCKMNQQRSQVRC